MSKKYPVNIWINEGRYEKLREIGLSSAAKDVLGGMKVLQVQCTEEQKDKILKRYPTVKFDASTTKSIELLPLGAKNKMFDLIVRKKNLDIIEEFLKSTK